MALTEPPGDFDYLWEDLGDLDEDFTLDRFSVASPRPPVPWYRTSTALVAIGAIGIAVVSILVSAVLLVSRDSRAPVPDIEATIGTTPPSTASTTPPMTTTVPAGPTEAPPPSEPTANAPVASAPVAVEPPPQQLPQPTKAPEIGVTRTPVTRSPISVRPAPRRAYPYN